MLLRRVSSPDPELRGFIQEVLETILANEIVHTLVIQITSIVEEVQGTGLM